MSNTRTVAALRNEMVRIILQAVAHGTLFDDMLDEYTDDEDIIYALRDKLADKLTKTLRR